MISHMTGANGNVVSLKGLDKDPLAIMLVMDNGDAQFLLTAPPPEESEDQEKIEKAIKEGIHNIVAEESIIGQSGKKKIKIPVKGIKEYRFVYGKNEGSKVVQGVCVM